MENNTNTLDNLFIKFQDILEKLSVKGLKHHDPHASLKELYNIIRELSVKIPAGAINFNEGQKEITISLLECILSISNNSNLPMEVSLLCGTCMASFVYQLFGPLSGSLLLIDILCFFTDNALELERSKESVEEGFKYSESRHFHNLVVKLTENAFNSQNLPYCVNRNMEALQSMPPSFCHLSILHGIVSCQKFDLLAYKIQNGNEFVPFLIAIFNPISHMCTTPCGFHFHAFQLLLAWIKIGKCILDKLHNEKNDGKLIKKNGTLIFSSDSRIVFEIVNILEANWESPINGVSDTVKKIYKILFEANEKESGITGIKSHFASSLLEKTMKLSWKVKGKYIVLSSILPYIGHKKFLETYPDSPYFMISNIKANYIASVIAELYKTVVSDMKNKSGTELLPVLWSNWWLDPIAKSLSSGDMLLLQNAQNHILPWTMEKIPESYLLLTEALKDNQTDKTDIIEVMLLRIAKEADVPSIHLQESCIVMSKLHHSNEFVRMEIFSILCSSTKRSEAICSNTLLLIKEFLLVNLNIDSSAFNQRIMTQMKLLLTRIRDSTANEFGVAAKRKIDFKSIDFSQIDFVEWLVQVALQNTFPGASYQRRRTCLQILALVFDVFLVAPKGGRKKEQPSANINLAVVWAQNNGRWMFFKDNSLFAILPCITDFVEDIRSSTANLLQEFFPWPDNTETDSIVNIGSLLKYAFTLCNSPHVQQCDSGALLCRILFVKYIIRKTMMFDFDCHLHTLSSLYEEDFSAILFLADMVKICRAHLGECKINFLRGASTSPVHGILLAICYFLSVHKEFLKQAFESHRHETCKLLQDLICLCNDTIKHMLFIMTGRAKENSVPSFAEIGQALEDLIPSKDNCDVNGKTFEDCSDDDDTDDDELDSNKDDYNLSLEFQLLLSCCWHSIKNSCFLLSDLVTPILSLEIHYRGLERKFLKEIAEILSSTLLRCRHRGVIEACSTALNQFCKCLLAAKENYQDIPMTLLEEALLTLSDATSTSVTRRSAGLALLVQAVVAGGQKDRAGKCLVFAFEKLLDIVSSPLPLSFDEKTDLPQAHAYHILSVLVADSRLSHQMFSWLERIVPICVSGFSSKCWAIRNGALQLFAVLVPRLCGQKKVKEDESEHNSICPMELFMRCPGLCIYLLKQLQSSVLCHQKKELCPELMPLLSLIVKISPGDNEKNGTFTNSLKPLLVALLESPIWYVRSLASSALTAFISPSEAVEQIQELLHSLINTPKISNNKINGVLQTIQKVFRLPKHNSPRNAEAILNILNWFISISGEDLLCDMTRSFLLDTIVILTELQGKKLEIKALPPSVNFVQPFSQAGNTLWKRACFLRSLQYSDDSKLPVLMQNTIFTDQDLTEVCLKFMKNKLKEDNEAHCSKESKIRMWRELLSLFLKYMEDEVQSAITHEILKFIISLCSNSEIGGKILDPILSIAMENCMLKLTEGKCGLTVAAFALTVASFCLQSCLQDSSDSCGVHLERWLFTFHIYCHPRKSEILRSQAAEFLAVAGSTIVKYLSYQLGKDLEWASTNLIGLCEGTLNLLQDEDQEIRSRATRFVSALPQSCQVGPVQCNVAVTVICKLMSDLLTSQEGFLQHLWCKLNNFPSTAKVLQAVKMKKKMNLFEQEYVNVYAEPVILAFYHAKQLQDALKALSERNYSKWLEKLEIYACDVKHEIEEIKAVVNLFKEADESMSCIDLAAQPAVFLSLTKLECQMIAIYEQKSILHPTLELNFALEEIRKDMEELKRCFPSIMYSISIKSYNENKPIKL